MNIGFMHHGSATAILAGAFGAFLLVSAPFAAVADEEADSPHSFSANVLVGSEYVFRGLAQSNEDLALQGGLDYAHNPSGFYVGFWASSIEFNAGPAGPSPQNAAQLETNIYGGFSGSFSNGIGWDIGGLYYWYPEENESTGFDYDYVEIYGSLSYAWEDVTWSPSIEAGFAWSPDYFGEDDDSIYGHGTLSFSLPHGISPYVTLGYIDVEGDKFTPGGYDYTHYAVGATLDLAIFTFDLSWQDAGDVCTNGSEFALPNDDLCEAVVFSVSSSW